MFTNYVKIISSSKVNRIKGLAKNKPPTNYTYLAREPALKSCVDPCNSRTPSHSTFLHTPKEVCHNESLMPRFTQHPAVRLRVRLSNSDLSKTHQEGELI